MVLIHTIFAVIKACLAAATAALLAGIGVLVTIVLLVLVLGTALAGTLGFGGSRLAARRRARRDATGSEPS